MHEQYGPWILVRIIGGADLMLSTGHETKLTEELTGLLALSQGTLELTERNFGNEILMELGNRMRAHKMVSLGLKAKDTDVAPWRRRWR